MAFFHSPLVGCDRAELGRAARYRLARRVAHVLVSTVLAAMNVPTSNTDDWPMTTLQRKGYTGFLSLVWLLFKEWRWANQRRMKVGIDVIAGGRWW